MFLLVSIEHERFLGEYQASLKLVRHAYKLAKERQTEQARLDCQQLKSMERDLLWALEYLETGIVPDYHRGIYKWCVPVDPARLRRMVRGVTSTGKATGWVTSDVELEDLLATLTAREREALIMVRGHGLSYRQAAEYMGGVSSGTVSATVRRAERKLRRRVLLTGV